MSEEKPSDDPPLLDQTLNGPTITEKEGAMVSQAVRGGGSEDNTTTATGATSTVGKTTIVASEYPASLGGAQMSNGDGDEGADGDDAAAAAEAARDENVEISGVPPNDVKNIILQVLSPYFDDEGGEDDAQHYDHIKAQGWIQLICDGIMEKLLGMRRPYKYVVHCMIMRKCGAGVHVCSSCYYSQTDGWMNHAHDLSAHIYAVVTVYWGAI